jgi:hypothetical protein
MSEPITAELLWSVYRVAVADGLCSSNPLPQRLEHCSIGTRLAYHAMACAVAKFTGGQSPQRPIGVSEEQEREMWAPVSRLVYEAIHSSGRSYVAVIDPCGTAWSISLPPAFTCVASSCDRRAMATTSRTCKLCGKPTVLVGEMAPIDSRGVGVTR